MTWDLRCTFSKSNAVGVLSLTGRLSGANAAALQAALEQGRHESASRLVVDLAGVDYLSSAGLRALEQSAGRCRHDGGRLVLAAVTDPVRISLELAGLVGQIQIEASIEAAAAAIAT